MGTNFYLHRKDACPCCKRDYEILHIGKSIVGWCFALRVYPKLGINDLEDWQKLWPEPNVKIVTDAGREITPEAMLSVITDRKAAKSPEQTFKNTDIHKAYASIREFYNRNGAIPGPNNLLRHRIDEYSHCVKHGAGTWDRIDWEFR